MDIFDPAINYGPNDVGASAVSIALVAIGLLIGGVLIAAAYGFLANLVKGDGDQQEGK